MSIAGVFLSLLAALLECAVVVLVAFVILWVLRLCGFEPDGSVVKWGRVVVALICLIIIIAWLFAVVSGTAVVPRIFWR